MTHYQLVGVFLPIMVKTDMWRRLSRPKMYIDCTSKLFCHGGLLIVLCKFVTCLWQFILTHYYTSHWDYITFKRQCQPAEWKTDCISCPGKLLSDSFGFVEKLLEMATRERFLSLHALSWIKHHWLELSYLWRWKQTYVVDFRDPKWTLTVHQNFFVMEAY